jgi:ABC-2 type transport system permease protein
MTTHLLTDSMTMLRRSLRRMRRYPSLTFFVAALPIVFLLLFVYVFGGALGAGLGAPDIAGVPAADASRDAYLAYVVPGVLLVTVAGAAQGTAISVAMDMTAGIIARFRTMSIARASVLGGHVIGAVLQTVLATGLVVAVAVLIGFRPSTGPLAWVAALGILVMVAIAISWLSVALGMSSDSVETASNLPFFLVLLPFLSSAFVPVESLPGPLAWFAEHQPFTPIIETLRGLLVGTPIGDSWWIAIAWCVGISAVGYLWALRLYERVPARVPA